MSNPYRGDVTLVMNGEPHVMRLTLGALAELECDYPDLSFVQLIEKFETGTFRAEDLLALLCAGLRGGGWMGTPQDLGNAAIEGGLLTATTAAGQLLKRAFDPSS